MKFLVDANLPPGLADWLRANQCEAVHISDLLGLTSDDRAVFDFAREHGYIIVTKDEDFAALTTLTAGPAPVVWLRLGNATNDCLRNWLEPLLPVIVHRLASGEILIEVV
jgi:predicted nuclease of predicted toxin-antitoxin system